MQSLHVKFISDNFKQFDVRNGVALKQDVFKYVQQCTQKFDLIFADPPYDLQRLAELPDLIFKHGLLHEDGLIILEHPKQHNFEQHPHFLQEKRYSNVHFSFFRNNTAELNEDESDDNP
jgi:16S rRNA (guanine966-N2)-methyltransferase